MPFAEKHIWSQPPVEVAGRHVKRYHVAPEHGDVEPEVAKAALDFLPALLPVADGTPPATFIVVHRSAGDGAAYLIAWSWVWDNVLHLRSAAAAQPELGCPDLDKTHFMMLERRWIGCVWELVPLLHERDAWVRHMLVPDEPDLDAYLADSMPDGTTGGRS